MAGRMTVFGAGHKIALVIVPVFVASILAGWRYREFFDFGGIPFPALLGTGIGLMVTGLGLNFVSAVAMMRAFVRHRLLTTGTYAFSRNPMYASFIFLTVPGLSLVLNCWAVLAVSTVMYAATAFFVGEEERWLAQRFGNEWEQYTRHVGRIFPKVW